jgi:hypothetical protein
MAKTKQVFETQGVVNYGRIKRNLMLRDTNNDLSRFTQRTETPKNVYRREKNRNYYQGEE